MYENKIFKRYACNEVTQDTRATVGQGKGKTLIKKSNDIKNSTSI